MGCALVVCTLFAQRPFRTYPAWEYNNFPIPPDWNEPAESSPDFGRMRKKEAQLLLVQDVLQEACDLGKLSKAALEEYIRYAEMETAQMQAVKKAWEERTTRARPD